MLATSVVEVSHDAGSLDRGGWWAVALTYEGQLTAARFEQVTFGSHPRSSWPGMALERWQSTMSEREYQSAVEDVRGAIARGDVYQANICRVLRAPMGRGHNMTALGALMNEAQRAPHGGTIVLPDNGVGVACASPELFLRRHAQTIESSPIKGTARTSDGFLEKDYAENVMIVDLVRNDLGRVCTTGSIEVPALLTVEEHPGLVHLVSTVRGTLRDDVGWQQILDATFPPGSVTGAPKSSALRIIDKLEPTHRGAYCGAIGWVDADRKEAELAVGIRTFWQEEDEVCFGTGAGITWGSDPEQEWGETQLKAERLLQLAASAN